MANSYKFKGVALATTSETSILTASLTVGNNLILWTCLYCTYSKEEILKFHGMDITSQLGQIIFKSEKRKLMLENTLNVKLDDDAELYSIIDANEIFNPKYYL